MKIHSDINDIDVEQWEQLIAHSSTATFFQTPACYNFYSDLSFFKPFVFGVSENEKLVGVMVGYIISSGRAIQRFFCRRAIVPGGLLLDSHISTEALTALLEEARKSLYKKAIYIEIQNYKDYNEYRLTFQASNFNYKPYLNFYVPSIDVETAKARLSDNLQNQLKLSVDAGVSWEETTRKEDIKAFYAKLKKQHRKSPKTTLFPLEFFEKLAVLPEGKLFVVKYQQQVMGGMACVILPDNTMYEWFLCEYSENNSTRGVSLEVAIYWSGIEYAAKSSVYRLEFMNIGKPVEDIKVREYKRKFGGQSVEMGRFLCINRPLFYFIGKLVLEKLIRKLRLIG